MQFMEAAVQLLNPDHFFRDRRSDPDRLAKKGFCKYQTEKNLNIKWKEVIGNFRSFPDQDRKKVIGYLEQNYPI